MNATRPKWRWIVGISMAVVPGIALAVFFAIPYDSTIAASPDGAYLAVVRESRLKFIDRNFQVLLVDVNTGAETEVFVSWDQSPLIKREKFVWSKDSKRFALVGDRYYVVDNSRLRDGLIVFLVYDIDTRKMCCNTDFPREYESISAEDAEKMLGGSL